MRIQRCPQTDSVFAKKYAEGMNKMDYWHATYEDSMNLIARLPEVAALIYRCTFHDGNVADYDSSLDYSGNFARMVSAVLARGCVKAKG